MIPAYQLRPDDFLEVVFAISELHHDPEFNEIEEFTGLNTRKVRESLNIGRELDILTEDEPLSVKSPYRQKIREVSPDDRDVLLNRALIQYRPFRSFGTYVRKGYGIENSARKTNVLYDIASDPEYIINYFTRYGEYAGVLTTSEEDENIEIEIKSRDIPTDSVESVEALRNAIESEAEVRFYLEEAIGSEFIAEIDADTEQELVDAYLEHAERPRDAITAAGRALEDYLRSLGKQQGDAEKYEDPTGIGQLADQLNGDGIIREMHRKRALAISGIRNKGGAHGDDQQTGNRWRESPEVALSVSMEVTLLIASIIKLVDKGQQVL